MPLLKSTAVVLTVREVRVLWANVGDAFLLCSDGVWEYLKEEILIDRVEGDHDNLTVVTLMIK